MIQILIDMNLPPRWVEIFEERGFEARHWSTIGAPRAPDTEIMAWARDNGFVVFTHDLDFGALLFATRATGPSVIQLRSEDIRPSTMASLVLNAINRVREELASGALVTIHPRRSRVAVLPLGQA